VLDRIVTEPTSWSSTFLLMPTGYSYLPNQQNATFLQIVFFAAHTARACKMS